MTILGLPPSMFAVFALTVLAGSVGAIHYTVVHIILKRPFGDEDDRRERRQGLGRSATDVGSSNGPGGGR